jgi:hypothetical protein
MRKRNICRDVSCYLQTRSLEKFLTEDMNVLQIENPESRDWFFLKDLGVTSEPNLELFLRFIRVQKSGEFVVADAPGVEDTLYKDLVIFCMTASSPSAIQ